VQLHTLTGTGTSSVVKERIIFPPSRPVPPARVDPAHHRRVRGSRRIAHKSLVASAMELTLPVTVTAVFSRRRKKEWFRFTRSKARSSRSAAGRSRTLPRPLPVLTCFDAADKVLGRSSAADAPDGQVEIDGKAPADGEYRLRLRDLQYGTRVVRNSFTA